MNTITWEDIHLKAIDYAGNEWAHENEMLFPILLPTYNEVTETLTNF